MALRSYCYALLVVAAGMASSASAIDLPNSSGGGLRGVVDQLSQHADAEVSDGNERRGTRPTRVRPSIVPGFNTEPTTTRPTKVRPSTTRFVPGFNTEPTENE